MSKQTAVDLLYDEVNKSFIDFIERKVSLNLFLEAIFKAKQQALIMEWEQIVEAYNEGNQSDWNNEIADGGEQYYNETYISNKG